MSVMHTLLSSSGWRIRRPLSRRRVDAALRGSAGHRFRSPADLAAAAGLSDIPPRELQAVLSDLINAGRAEGLRDATSWRRVRAVNPAPVPGSTQESATLVPVHGGGWTLAAAGAGPVTNRGFSVTARLPRKRGQAFLPGLLLFIVALSGAGIATMRIARPAEKVESHLVVTREDWYRETGRRYADGYLAGRAGFDLPPGFTEVTGVAERAPRATLAEGLERYMQTALFTGAPSRLGLLTWARGEFGEMPAPGPAADQWLATVARTYAARSLEGQPGYEVTPDIRRYGEFPASDPNSESLATGIEKTIRAAVYLGTPSPGGIGDWARRTLGELPSR